MAQKRAAFRLADFDRKAILAAIEFANIKVESAKQVMALFKPLARKRWRTVPDESVRDFREQDQREVRSWLTQIVERGNVAPEVRAEVAERVKTIEVPLARITFVDGRLQPALEIDLTGVQACYSYAIALLVSRDNDRLAKRLGRCEKCGRFFFDDRKGAGAPRRYCSPEHKNQHGVWQFAHPGQRWKRPDLP